MVRLKFNRGISWDIPIPLRLQSEFLSEAVHTHRRHKRIKTKSISPDSIITTLLQ